MKQLNDNRSIVVNNVNYFTVHLNLKKMSPIPPILAISKQYRWVVQPIWKERITLTRSILNKIGREFIRFLRPDFYGEREKLWMEREEISHFEEIFFFFSFNGRTFPRNRWWKLHHRFRTCGWGRRLNQKSKRVIVPFHVSVFINIHEKRNYYNSPGYITIQG